MMLTILVVDDQEVMRDVMSAMLSDYNVFQAGSAREALGILSDQQVDMVVSDLQMPKMDGHELRAAVPGKPFLFVSGNEKLFGMTEVNGTPLLSKPFDRQSLIDKVRKILGG